ncbi:terminase small subunit [Shewanella baltica]|nr:terminase small subunit [Shewanella baltica]MCS6272611.1 terminase small subunit [Shewanella baltica]
MAIVNRNEFADLVGKSAKWVGEWIKDGMPTEGGGGRGNPVMIDTVKAIDWLINREVVKQVGDDEDDERKPKAGTKDGEELLTAIAKRRKAVVEADKAEESVIDLEDAGQLLYAISTLFGNELNGLGARLATEVAPINDPAQCKNKIDGECRRVRAATADRLRGFVSEYRAQRSRHGGREATEECSGVGDE